jgi:hypothetical protein
MSNVIKVPKPSRAAYNPNRRLEKNLLIKAQVEHFREAELSLPDDLRTGIDIADVKTEGQASHYIRLVTRAIHKVGGRMPEKVRTAR